MAKISTYPNVSSPSFSDMLIGTDTNDMNSTKNFSISDIFTLANSTLQTIYVPYTGAISNVDLGLNDIQANAFVKVSGLSTEFLKADGSVDSTTYLDATTALSTYVPYIGANTNVDLGANGLTSGSLEIVTDNAVMVGIQCRPGANDFFEIGSNGFLVSGFLVDFVNNRYYLGDWGGQVNNTYIHIDDVNQEIELSQALKTNGSVGSAGQVLVSQGATLPATWATPPFIVPNYGSFYDVTTQTTLGATQELMQFGTTDFSSGVTITNDGLGDPTRITFSEAGTYNIQFSAQIERTGGSADTIYIYLIKNGVAVPNSSTAITVGNNNRFVIAAWNFFVDIPSIPYNCQIGWYSTGANVNLHYDASPVAGIPAIPSVILTVNRIA
jgi:hypothetical protein